MSNNEYFLDLARSDILGDLVLEAVIPTIADVSTFAVVISFLLFLTANFVAIQLIVKPVKQLSDNVERIRPDDLSDRISSENVPSELLPVVIAGNHALERLEQGYEEQKRFVADAAHELRTPLTILLSRIELFLTDDPLKQKLQRDTLYISRIVEQLLDLSRAQKLSQNKLQSIDIVPIVKEMCGLLAPLAVDKHQALSIETMVKNSFVLADEGELSVVIKNLVENAIKYTPISSNIRISISENTLCVEDSGEGIPIELQTKIFDRFYRINQSDLSGSGLGLAITKELVSHFNAQITVGQSIALGGAHFKIVFKTP